MKWINKGHEFDETGTYFKETKTIFFYGAIDSAESLIEMTEFAIKRANNNVTDVNIELVDRDVEKQNNVLFGKKVISPDEFYRRFFDENAIVVVNTVNPKSAEQIFIDLEEHGIRRRYNSFDGNYEFNRYLSLFIHYRYNNLFFHFLDTFVHTYCNLKCKHCCIKTNNGIRKNISIDEIKRNIDLFFDRVDSVGIISFGVADGFLSGQTAIEGIKYAEENYFDRFLRIEFTTNGTVYPTEKLIEVLKLPKIRVIVDDYRDNVKKAEITFPEIIRILDKNGVDYIPLKRTFWYKSDFNEVDCSSESEDKLSQKHFDCIWHAKGFPFHGYSANSSRIYNCSFQAINTYLDLFEENEQDSIDIESSSNTEIIEFILGYTENGYLTACKRCNGMFEKQMKTHIPVAEQE